MKLRKKGLKYIALTDHYFGSNKSYLENMNDYYRIVDLPKRINLIEKDINVIASTEFNLNQKVFNEEDYLNKLPWKAIGYHHPFMDKVREVSLDELYVWFLKSAVKGYNAFIHIERGISNLNNGNYTNEELLSYLKKIVDLAIEYNIFLEVNESDFISNERTVFIFKEWIKYAAQKNAKIFLGTDSHHTPEIGLFEKSLEYLNKINYPKELILNFNEKMLKEMFA
jgi:histidinol phosphatase-like PHP family hydrolase